MKSPGFLGSVFDTGLSVTLLMGHIGCLASHWSVPVHSLIQYNNNKIIKRSELSTKLCFRMLDRPKAPMRLVEQKAFCLVNIRVQWQV